MSERIASSYRGFRAPTRHFDDPPASTENERICREARERFRQIVDWETDFRSAFVEDMRFCHGDSDNHWQWPGGLFSTRAEEDRPSLTVNKTRQHVLQIVNDAKQNKPQVRVNPVSDEASKEAADVFEGVVRHIEYVSNATAAYDTASEHQVAGGIGWWRIVTDYEDEGSFEQAIFIRRIRDPMTIYLDPDIREADGSDARFGFVVDDVPRDQFEFRYPQYRDYVPDTSFSGNIVPGGWMDEDHIRVCEYYTKDEEEDTLHQLPDGSIIRESELYDATLRAAAREQSVRRRELKREVVRWYKIVGGTIVDEGEWPGRYIPLVRVIGEEAIIEGRLERKGHVRALKDPQRIYNYWTSSGVEAVALQSKTPYIAAAESIENYQRTWDTANTTNHAVLPFNARDDKGDPLPPPQRQEPPQMPQAYIQGLQIAQQEMMLVSGQYQPTMGQPSTTETTAKAIALRQRSGETATFHYSDGLASAIRYTGRILIDLIPKVYDTPRIIRVLNVDNSVDRVRLDPTAPQALTTVQSPTAPQQAGMSVTPPPQQLQRMAVLRVFNPSVGKYEVQADIGPNYQTRRQQAFDAFVTIVQQAPQLFTVAGDLLFRSADFPLADELAERLQRMVPPQALGQGPSPAEAQMQQQLQQAQAHIALLGEKLAVAEMKLTGKDQQKDIDAYEAQTKRMGTLLAAKTTDSGHVSGGELETLIRNLVADALAQRGLAPVAQTSLRDMAIQAPGYELAAMRGNAAPGPPPSANAMPGMVGALQ